MKIVIEIKNNGNYCGECRFAFGGCHCYPTKKGAPRKLAFDWTKQDTRRCKKGREASIADI